jgi:hypothetical protein
MFAYLSNYLSDTYLLISLYSPTPPFPNKNTTADPTEPRPPTNTATPSAPAPPSQPPRRTSYDDRRSVPSGGRPLRRASTCSRHQTGCLVATSEPPWPWREWLRDARKMDVRWGVRRRKKKVRCKMWDRDGGCAGRRGMTAGYLKCCLCVGVWPRLSRAGCTVNTCVCMRAAGSGKVHAGGSGSRRRV